MKYTTQHFNMDTPVISSQAANSTLATLANANELVRCVAQEVVGNEIADTINGSPISRETIYSLSQATIMKQLSNFRKV